MSTTKSQIKHDVFRKHFFSAVRTVKKGELEGKMANIPMAEPDDPEQTLQNVTAIIDDTPIRLQGWTNVMSVSTHVSPTGYQVSGATGETLVNYLISPVRRAFETHTRLETYVMVFDKGIFVPPPKTHTQVERTKAMLNTMEKQQITPIVYDDSESMPVVVARGQVVPPWIAVRVDRTLYRHAVNQLIALVLEEYKPPPGRRLIIDMLDMSVAWPENLDVWMTGESIMLTDYAKSIVDRARAALKPNAFLQANWRSVTQKIARELAQSGDLISLPFCLETDVTGETFTSFVLPNAANQCGEADIGVLFWLDALQEKKRHETLSGNRSSVPTISPELAEFYSAKQLADTKELREATMRRGPTDSNFERLRHAQRVLAADPDLILHTSQPQVRAHISLGMPLTPQNPCRRPNRVLVFSVDSDFLSLVPLWFARFCTENAADEQYCIDNSPLVLNGECKVNRLGWLQSYEDYCKGAMRPQKRKRGADDDDDGDDDGDGGEGEQVVVDGAAAEWISHEIYDVHRMYKLLLGLTNTVAVEPRIKLEAAASFALFCGACGNDFMAGIYFINRNHSFQSFCAVRGSLIHYDERCDEFLIVEDAHKKFLTGCYYFSLLNARGAKNKPESTLAETSYATMSDIVRSKYKTGKNCQQKHMPDTATRKLMLSRLQWWIVYASSGWRTITRLLDDSKVGWVAGTTDRIV